MDEAWLNTVRMARECGDISSLFPPGVERLVDLPFTLHNAILSALGYLGFEELPEDERPPKRIWLSGKKMEAWFREVKLLRKAKMEGRDTEGTTRNALLDLLED